MYSFHSPQRLIDSVNTYGGNVNKRHRTKVGDTMLVMLKL